MVWCVACNALLLSCQTPAAMCQWCCWCSYGRVRGARAAGATAARSSQPVGSSDFMCLVGRTEARWRVRRRAAQASRFEVPKQVPLHTAAVLSIPSWRPGRAARGPPSTPSRAVPPDQLACHLAVIGICVPWEAMALGGSMARCAVHAHRIVRLGLAVAATTTATPK